MNTQTNSRFKLLESPKETLPITTSKMSPLGLVFTLISIAFYTYPVFSYNIPNDVKKWCTQTPNPEPCEYFMSQNLHSYGNIKGKRDFQKKSIQLTLERALRAESHTASLGSQCRNELEKRAWADCLELYENTVLQLNHTTGPYCTSVDQQTWLSTALTNLETCKTGFIELGVPDYMLPLMSNNVSKLICNSLALNKIPPGEHKTYKDGNPSWLSGGYRKLLQSTSPASRANLVVAKDGSGNFKTIKEAVNAISSRRTGSGRFIIYVKRGTYKENVEVGNKLKNIMFVGDGIGNTIITGSKSVKGGSTTFSSATLAVTGEGFIARDMSIINTAGPSNHQAVALRSGSDFSVFYRCSFEGYQDTLYPHSQRQFYKECDVYGTVDFIFGNAAVVLQNCNIFPRRPMSGQENTITAQGRTDSNQNTGISIHNSRVTPAADLKAVQSSVKTYLGRPWKQYSRTVFLQTSLDSFIAPAGWLEWDGNFALKTLYYGEYKNTGPGSSTSNRVKWGGYHVITSATEASKFSVSNLISENPLFDVFVCLSIGFPGERSQRPPPRSTSLSFKIPVHTKEVCQLLRLLFKFTTALILNSLSTIKKKMSSRSSRLIYVGNLPLDIRESEIEDLFYKYGRIVDIELKIPPRPPGYCFVEFEDSRDAQDAIRGRDGYNFDGCHLRVELSHGGRGQSFSSDRRGGHGGGGGGRSGGGGASRRSEYRVVVRGLPSSASWQDLKDHMRKAGDVCFAQVFRKGEGTMGLVDYTNYEDMKYAIRKLHDTEFKNPFSRGYIRVKAYEGSASRSPSRSRSCSRSRSVGRKRSKSVERPISRSASTSRSVSRSRSVSPARPRSRSGSPKQARPGKESKD